MSSSVPSGSTAQTEIVDGGPPARRGPALAVLVMAGFMDLLDTTIVNVAIPAIRDDLSANYAQLQWIVAGYLLALAVGLITGGRLGDLFGRRRVFLLGLTGFGLASLASGLAPTAGVLVATRLLQGTAAAVMIPQILSIVQVSFPREAQARALAVYSAVAGIAVMSGPLLAGFLLDVAGWSWRSIFLVNVPVCIVTIVAARGVVPESRSSGTTGLDLGGVVLVSAALFALIYGIIEGREQGWPTWTVLLLGLSIPLFVGFAWYERRLDARGGSPLISPDLWRQGTFSAGIVVVTVFFTGTVAFFLAFTIFLQLGLGFTALESALTTFPSSIGLAVASLLAGRLAPRFGRRVLAGGALTMALAMSVLVAVVDANGAALTAWDVRPVIFVFGLGMGLIIPPLADVIIGDVHQRHAGSASGVINTGMQVGNALGVAVVGVILFAALGSHAPASVATIQPALVERFEAVGLPEAAHPVALERVRTCFVDRSQEEDPNVVPPSCSGPGDPAVGELLAAANADNFVWSIQRVLFYEIGVFVMTFVLLLVLPIGRRRRGGDPDDASDPPASPPSNSITSNSTPPTRDLPDHHQPTLV